MRIKPTVKDKLYNWGFSEYVYEVNNFISCLELDLRGWFNKLFCLKYFEETFDWDFEKKSKFSYAMKEVFNLKCRFCWRMQLLDEYARNTIGIFPFGE